MTVIWHHHHSSVVDIDWYKHVGGQRVRRDLALLSAGITSSDSKHKLIILQNRWEFSLKWSGNCKHLGLLSMKCHNKSCCWSISCLTWIVNLNWDKMRCSVSVMDNAINVSLCLISKPELQVLVDLHLTTPLLPGSMKSFVSLTPLLSPHLLTSSIFSYSCCDTETLRSGDRPSSARQCLSANINNSH